MARRKKTSTRTKTASTDTGNRLTPQQRIDIAKETGTNKEVAEKYGVSINTAAKYRGPAARTGDVTGRRGRKPTATGSSVGLKATFEGGEFVVRFSRKDLLRMLAETE